MKMRFRFELNPRICRPLPVASMLHEHDHDDVQVEHPIPYEFRHRTAFVRFLDGCEATIDSSELQAY